MKTKLSEAGERNFDLLTASTFYVVDTEYTATGDEARTNSIISIAIVPIRQGRIDTNDVLYCEMNPGVPISEVSSEKHGFTDKSVKRKRRFDFYAQQLLKKLSEKNAVFVSHTSVDVHAIRAELTRLDTRKTNGEAVSSGLANLPNLVVIDTSRLAQSLGYPGAGSRAVIGLAELCNLTKVSNENPHNAKSDARATAHVLLELLAFAAQEKAISDLGEVLRTNNAKTTHNPSPEIWFREYREVEPELPAEHLSKHCLVLDHIASVEEISSWVEVARECSELRCQWLLDDVIIASELNALALYNVLDDALPTLLPTLTAPGQAATFIGALCELLDPRERTGGTALPGTKAIRWWGRVGQGVAKLPKCGTEISQKCPACRRGEICGLDSIHQVIARTALIGEGKELSNEKSREMFRENHAARIRQWTPKYPELAAFAAWFVIKRDMNAQQHKLAQDNLQVAIQLGLQKIEPRLALMVAEQMTSANQSQEALDLCDEVQIRRSTDTAFDELEEWAKLSQVGLSQRAKSTTKPAPTHPRLSRPAGRVNPNPYSVL